ncbi:hypothetical protein D3C81_1542740 [compost metagenome]
MALRILSFGTSVGMDAQTWGVTKAALTPAAKRKRFILKKLYAKEQSAVETAKPARPAIITFLRLRRSDKGPAIKANKAYPKA